MAGGRLSSTSARSGFVLPEGALEVLAATAGAAEGAATGTERGGGSAGGDPIAAIAQPAVPSAKTVTLKVT